MELHSRKLDSLCRLCRCKIIVDTNYISKKHVTDFSLEIQEIFSYNVQCDDETIHPKYLCNNCRRKLQKYQKNSFYVVPVEMAVFPSHSNENCEICDKLKQFKPYKFQLRNTTMQKVNAHEQETTNISELSMQELEEKAKSHNFYAFSGDEFGKIYSHISAGPSIPQIDITVKIFNDFSWNVHLFKMILSKNICCFEDMPTILNKQNVDEFFSKISKLKICPSNCDFPNIINDKLSYGKDLNFYDKSKKIKAKIEADYFMSSNDFSTIRSVSCDKLIESKDSMCVPCSKLRRDLLVTSHRLDNKSDDKPHPRPNTANIYLDRDELIEKCEQQQRTIRNLRKVVKRLDQKISACIENESVVLNDKTNGIIENVFLSQNPGFENDSPKKLLWEQQLKMSQCKRKSSMRWHPLIIRWCLSIYLKSPTAYEHLRDSGFIELPHRTTLNTYTGFASSTPGFKPEIAKRMFDDVKMGALKEHERNVIIKFDEMKIKQGLVYCRSSGELRGFTELGDLNKELEQFDRSFSEEGAQSQRDLASHVMCFMVGGLLKRFSFPVAYFSSLGFSSDQIYSLTWKSIGILETVGLKVLAIVCDGASPNRRFFKMHQNRDESNVSEDGVVFWTENRFDPERKIFFFSDPPHLLKTIRNNLENSGSNSRTRMLKRGGFPLSWLQIVDLYEWDLGLKRVSPGLRKLHRLTEDHVNLTPRLRMRVNLAAQVISRSVSSAMALRKLPETKEMERFIRKTDKFFDCLNVNNTFYGQKCRKKALYKYDDENDWRFNWLLNNYLKYINDWKEETNNLTNIPKESRAKYCLSNQTIEGIRITVRSFVEMVPLLIRNAPKGSYFLSGKINQDDVEEHFGRVRMRGGSNENPTVHEYGFLNRKVIVAKSDLLKMTRGNTRGRQKEDTQIEIDETPLPKRPKKSL